MVLLESNYFPCIDYCSALANATSCTIEQWETFRKMSFRNRCIIIGSNGLINLTIPVEGGRNNKQLLKDVRISYSENWQQQHWKGIVSSYAKSPFFEYYQAPIEQLIKKNHSFLIDKNMEILLWLNKVLGLKNQIGLSTEYYTTAPCNTTDYRQRWMPNNYQDIANSSKKYYQMFEEKLGFQKNASILDLLFCEGPNSLGNLINSKSV